MNVSDQVSVHGAVRCFAYEGDVQSPETLVSDTGWMNNLVTTVGKQFFADKADGVATVPPASLINLAVGSGNAAAAVGDTALTGPSTYYQAFDSLSRTGSTVTYTTTIGTANANFAHAELGLCNGTAGSTVGILVTHLAPMGPLTKSSVLSFVYVYQLTFN